MASLKWTTPIQEFQDKDFDSKGSLKKSFTGSIAVYANWCGHCVDLHPIYQQFAKKVAGFYDVGVIDESKGTKFKEAVGIKGFPTILLYKNGKKVGVYSGPRDLEHLIEEAKSG